MNDLPASPLSENHFRNISCVLALLDETLCQFERWAAGGHASGVLFREENTLTDEQSRAIMDEIVILRGILAGIKDDLSLEIEVKDVSRSICAGSLAWWPALVELGSKHLRRYGVVPREFAKYFDPKVKEIIAHVTRISDVAQNEQSSGETPEKGLSEEG